MKNKLIIWLNGIFKKEKISLDARAEHLFKAYASITEECSPISRAKVFDLFKQIVIEDFQEEEKRYKDSSVILINHANKCEKALQTSFNIGWTKADIYQQNAVNHDVNNFHQKQ